MLWRAEEGNGVGKMKVIGGFVDYPGCIINRSIGFDRLLIAEW
jgi:hypothetical protein